MYKFKEGFTYVENKTLTGNKLLVGIKEYNSYILLKADYRESFYILFSKINNSPEKNFELSAKEKKLLEVFDEKGFLDNGKEPKKSFNEYNALVHFFCEIKIKINQKEHKKKVSWLFYFGFVLIFLIGLVFFVVNYNTFINIRLDIQQFSLKDIILCITIVPLGVNMTHEFGHFLIAWILGVKVDSISLGFFVTAPTIFLQYKGLNLQTTLKKVCIASAGVFVHLLNSIIGIVIYNAGITNIVCTVWIMANIGMVITNLMLSGPSDGYFIITSLLGIYNLRYKGYKSLNKIFTGSKENLNFIDKICMIMLFLFWIESFIGIFFTCKYYFTILSFNSSSVYIVVFIWVTFLLIKFIKSIKTIG